jgi:CHAT domain-containing protein/tetratricopeptide (TPR) repeat protein
MKFIFACIFFIISLLSSAQTNELLDLMNQSLQYQMKGDYVKSIPVFDRMLQLIKQQQGEKNTLYTTVLSSLAQSHLKLSHYQVAESLYLRQKEIYSEISGTGDINYIGCLHSLGNLFLLLGEYSKADNYYNEAFVLIKKLTPPDTDLYTTNLNNRAQVLQARGRFADALQLLLECEAKLKKEKGENAPVYTTILNNLSSVYIEMADYDKALPLLEKSAVMRKNIFSENHFLYAESLNNLSYYFNIKGQYAIAIRYAVQAISIIKMQLGEYNDSYASCINNLAEMYSNAGEYPEAEKLHLQAADIRKKIYGVSHPDYAASIGNLASLYVQIGEYPKALQLFSTAEEIIRKTSGEFSASYATLIGGEAVLYQETGEYPKAEKLNQDVIAIKRILLGENHPGYANALSNLGNLYYALGQNEKAKLLIRQAMLIRKNSLGEDHPDYASSINDLAMLEQASKDYGTAEQLFIQSGNILKQSLGTSHPGYAIYLNNLAGLYLVTKQYKRAEALLTDAKKIWELKFGNTSPLYALGLNNLAAFYRQSSQQYSKAEIFYKEAIEIRKKRLGVTHPVTSDTENDLGLLYTHTGQVEKAVPLLVSSSKNLLATTTSFFSILSEKEKGNWLEYNRRIQDHNNSLLFAFPQVGSAVVKNNYDLLLGFKSLSLADTKNMLAAVRKSSDTAVRRLFDKWSAVKKILARQYIQRQEEVSADVLKNLEQEAESLEKELNRRSSLVNSQLKSLRISTREIQEKLAPDEAAIEFVNFKLYNKEETDTTIYAAYILRKNDSIPVFVPLCNKYRLQQVLDSGGSSARQIAQAFYRGLELNSATVKTGTALYNLIWKPIENHLSGIRKISYSPAGKLYKIAFHALPVDSTTCLMDIYELWQYTSTRQIALRTNSDYNKKPAEAAFFGDALFTMDSIQIARQHVTTKTAAASPPVKQSPTRGTETAVWNNLPGTADEIKKIITLFANNRIKTQSFLKAAASEDNLKSLSNKSPALLHIATHGFFYPEPEKQKTGIVAGNVYMLAKDPLLRSGLVMAGANYVWNGKIPVYGTDDGIATAYEISQLNLSSTELVVLSACETALGDVKGSEGVFGLQRAFKMAGVKKMIVSLWQVPDKETAELMTAFYGYWLKGKNVNEAFYQAQADMRKKYSPFYWAAFVLVE